MKAPSSLRLVVLLFSCLGFAVGQVDLGAEYAEISGGNTATLSCTGERCLLVANRATAILLMESTDNGKTYLGEFTGSAVYGINSHEVQCVQDDACIIASRRRAGILSVESRLSLGLNWLKRRDFLVESENNLFRPKLRCFGPRGRECVLAFHSQPVNVASGSNSLRIMKTRDFGATWSAVRNITLGSLLDASDPHLGCHPSGNCVVAFRGQKADANGSLMAASSPVGMVMHSSDGGETWGNPVELQGANMSDMLNFATDCATREKCVLLASVGNSSGHRFIARSSSSDGGATWEALEVLAKHDTHVYEGPELSCTDVMCAAMWHVENTPARPLQALSFDFGKSFVVEELPIIQPPEICNEVYVSCNREKGMCASAFTMQNPVTVYVGVVKGASFAPSAAPTQAPTNAKCCSSSFSLLPDSICEDLECGKGSEAICVKLDCLESRNQSSELTPEVESLLGSSRASSLTKSLTFAMFGVSMLCVALSALLMKKHRGHPVIQAAQPGKLWLILLGASLSSSSIAFLAIDDGTTFLGSFPIASDEGGNQAADVACMAAVWFLGIGFVLMYAVLIIKMNVIYQIFNTSVKMPGWEIKRRRKIYRIAIALFLLVEAGILLTWSVHDPLKYTRDFSLGNGVLQSRGHCTSSSAVLFLSLLAIVHFLLILYALRFCMLTGKIHSAFSEGKDIRYAVLNGLQFTLLAVPIIIYSRDGDTLVIMRAGAVALHDISLLYFIFWPKFMMIRNGIDDESIGSSIIHDVVNKSRHVAASSSADTSHYHSSSVGDSPSISPSPRASKTPSKMSN